METQSIDEEKIQELLANYVKYLSGGFGVTGVTVMDKLLKEAGFITSDGLLDWDGFIKLSAARGIPASSSRIRVSPNTSAQPSTRIGPRGGRYTEARTRDGRWYRRYF
jgi:hypothetical protein